MDYDAIVAGAGPGGATAAREMAWRGLKVILLDPKALPRYKPCGGCLSLKIDRVLEEWSAGTLRDRFLPASERPFPSCEHSRLMILAGGLATVVVLRTCCLVDDRNASCLPHVA